MTQTIEHVLREVEESARARAKPDAVVHTRMEIGDYYRQGDIYIQRQSAPQVKLIAGKESQLAPGNSSGSRHVITAATRRNCQVYSRSGGGALNGPLLECTGPVEIGHPEHGHVTIPPGWYAITYQRQLADELQRVED